MPDLYLCHHCGKSTPISVTCCDADAAEKESVERFFGPVEEAPDAR